MTRLFAALLIVWLFASTAEAGGRFSCRVGTLERWSIACNLEQSLIVLGPLEVAGGVRWQPLESSTPVAYTALLVTLEAWWVALEIGGGLQGFYGALSVGFRW